jgi:hypothetical protein
LYKKRSYLKAVSFCSNIVLLTTTKGPLLAHSGHLSFAPSRISELSFEKIPSQYPLHVAQDPVAVFAAVNGLVGIVWLIMFNPLVSISRLKCQFFSLSLAMKLSVLR